jgi:hypothetical protein
MQPLTKEDLDLETRILPWLRSDLDAVVYGDSTYECVLVHYVRSLGYEHVSSGYGKLSYYTVDGPVFVHFHDTILMDAMFAWDNVPKEDRTGMTAARALEIAESVLAGV